MERPWRTQNASSAGNRGKVAPFSKLIGMGAFSGKYVIRIIITMAYARYSKKRLDPQVEKVRALAETDEELA